MLGKPLSKKFIIISDYAHHPTEIKATMEAAREKFTNKKIWCIFQPHQYQRTFYLFNDFVRVFSKALRLASLSQGKPLRLASLSQGKPLRQTQGKPTIDKLIITDIYDVAGREKKGIKKKISSEELIKAVNKSWAIYLPKEKIKTYLEKNLKSREVVIIMGAGDIYKLVEEFSTK